MLSLTSMVQCCLTFSGLTSLETNSKFLTSAATSSSCSSAVSNRRISRIRCAAEGDEQADDFEARLAKLQRKVTSGTGKKAELRKARKEGADPYAAPTKRSSLKQSIILPPVLLEEPMSDGLPVEMGFNSYTERLNGRFAALGLAAVLLVELATGGAMIKFHDSSTLATQVYVVLGAAALLVKLEKEKISVWPKT